VRGYAPLQLQHGREVMQKRLSWRTILAFRKAPMWCFCSQCTSPAVQLRSCWSCHLASSYSGSALQGEFSHASCARRQPCQRPIASTCASLIHLHSGLKQQQNQ
jgi:hypothetical protein